MKNRKLALLLLCCLVFSPKSMCGIAGPDNILFVNTGRMNIAIQKETGVAVFIPDAIRQVSAGADSVNVTLGGTLEVGGNFYQDANTHVFHATGSNAIFRFVSNRNVARYISTYSEDINAFDRSISSIAFPAIELTTNDPIHLPPRMGIDANSIHRKAGNGFILLRSGSIGTKVYNASLRIVSAGTSENLIDAGIIQIEQWVKTYRNGTQLFAFASPFKNTQLSGYFAGNWVRRPQADGLWNHTTYVLGNKPSTSNAQTIHLSQYMTNPLENLKTAQAYLVKPRPGGFAYSSLQANNGLTVTGASASLYDQDNFLFNGKVYDLPPYQEQVFAEDVLFSQTIPAGTTLTSTVNWLIGNSYTCPISIALLIQAMKKSSLQFSPVIYIFPAGSTSYQPLNISGAGDAIQVSAATEIPAMSIFMLRLTKGQTVNGNSTFQIGKELLVHGNAAHNSPMRSKTLQQTKTNQITLRISPDTNANVYDLAAIGIRDSAKEGTDTYDMPKVYNGGNDGFQLFSLSATGTKLSANAIPPSSKMVSVGFKPADEAGEYHLQVSGQESMTTEGLWLEDMQTKNWVDLLASSDYSFASSPTDNTNRFRIHFEKPVITGLTPPNAMQAYYAAGYLHLRNLTANDLKSIVNIYDISGRLIAETPVITWPQCDLSIEQSAGIYVAKIVTDNQLVTVKFIKE